MFKRFGVSLSVAVVAMMVMAVNAFAAPSMPDLTPAVEEYGETILNNIVPLLAAVLGVAAFFTLLKIGVSTVKGWIGKSRATSSTN